MHHLFLGISPASLVHAPYNPAISQGLTLNAEQYGLHIHRKGQLLMLPDIAGYVGADTCGCILALRQDQQNEISLMIDIGTKPAVQQLPVRHLKVQRSSAGCVEEQEQWIM